MILRPGQPVTLKDGRRCYVDRILSRGELIVQQHDGRRIRVRLEDVVEDPPNSERPDMRTTGR